MARQVAGSFDAMGICSLLCAFRKENDINVICCKFPGIQSARRSKRIKTVTFDASPKPRLRGQVSTLTGKDNQRARLGHAAKSPHEPWKRICIIQAVRADHDIPVAAKTPHSRRRAVLAPQQSAHVERWQCGRICACAKAPGHRTGERQRCPLQLRGASTPRSAGQLLTRHGHVSPHQRHKRGDVGQRSFHTRPALRLSLALTVRPRRP